MYYKIEVRKQIFLSNIQIRGIMADSIEMEEVKLSQQFSKEVIGEDHRKRNRDYQLPEIEDAVAPDRLPDAFQNEKSLASKRQTLA